MSESRDESNKYIVVSDQPATEDSLGFTPYVIAIAEFLTSPDTKPPLTLSIEGEWGSGKSSFMKQLKKQIEENTKKLKQKPQTIEFNAWRHDKAESLWAAFALSFLEEISNNRDRRDIIPNLYSNFLLFKSRIDTRKNWLVILQKLANFSFILVITVTIPYYFFTEGKDQLETFSQKLCCMPF